MSRWVVRVALGVGLAVGLALALSACQPAVVLGGHLSLSPGGPPAAGVQVVAFSSTSETQVAQTWADGSGDYQFGADVLPGGTYRVRISDADWWHGSSSWAAATNVAVSAAAPVTIDEVLTPAAGSVSGIVTDGANASLNGVKVEAVNVHTTKTIATRTSNPNGVYQFGALAAGDYRIRFSKAGFTTRYSNSATIPSAAPTLNVTAGGSITAVNTKLVPESTITGRVVGLTSALRSSASVVAYAWPSGDVVATLPLPLDDAPFVIHGLDAGSYKLEVVDAQPRLRTLSWGTKSTDLASGTTFALSAGGAADGGDQIMYGKDCDPTFIFPIGADLHGSDLSHKSLINCVSYSTVNLTGANLSGADLTGAELSRTTLTDANLTHASLYGARLFSANLTRADLTGSELAFAMFSSATVDDAVLTGTHVESTQLDYNLPGVRSGGVTGSVTPDVNTLRLVDGYLIANGVNLEGAQLSGLSMPGANLASVDADGADLEGADLHDGVFDSWSLVGAHLSDANLVSSHFATSDFTGAIVDGADLSGIVLTGTDLSGADLNDVAMLHASLTGTTVTGTKFSGANLSRVRGSGSIGTPATLPSGWQVTGGFLLGPGADLSRMALAGLDLHGVVLSSAYLWSADLTLTNLAGAMMTNVDLTSARLDGANLVGANITGGRFFGATVDGTQLQGAILFGASSGNVGGTPATLPTNWNLRGYYLVGPGADLRNAALGAVDLSATDLDWADLSGATVRANLHGASIQGTVFTGADLRGVSSGGMVGNPVNLPIGWSMITGYLLGPGANLDGADLSGLVLERFDLAGARFVGADLSGTDLDGGDLTGAILVNAKVNGAALDATMTGVSSGGLIGQPLRLPAGWTTIAGYFVGPDADLQLADLRNTTLTGVKLDGANLSQAQLAGVVSGGITGTPQALPTGWHLLGGYLIGPGANLANANLSGVSLAGFNLNSVVFTNANLTGVSLAGSAVGNANFSGATGTPSGGSTAVYSATRCPDLTVTSAAQPTCVGHGFNP